MFPFHQSTRRRILLALFVAICVLPTCLVLACGAWRHLPWYASWEAERLSDRLGLKVLLDAVEHPRPGVVRYRGLKCIDPETGRIVLRCDTLQVAQQSADSAGQSAASLVLSTPRAEVTAAELDQVWRLLERALRCQIQGPDQQIRLSADEVILRGGPQPATLVQVECRLESTAAKSQAEMGFRLAGMNMPEPAWIRVVRDRQSHPPWTWLALSTGVAALPCPVLAMGIPPLGSLGDESRFRGRLWAGEMPDGWAGEVTGEISGVELGRLVSDRFAHKIRGAATLTVQAARFREGRLQEAAATLVGGPGSVSPSLLQASARYLGCAPGDDPHAPGPLVPYEQLAFSAAVDSRGVQLRGHCRNSPAGTILADRYGPLLGEPASQPQAVAALLQALVPGSAVQVPATTETDWLMRLLPLPNAVPVGQSESALSAGAHTAWQ